MINRATTTTTTTKKFHIDWELNERISLSSGSSTGLKIRPDMKNGIGIRQNSSLDLMNVSPCKKIEIEIPTRKPERDLNLDNRKFEKETISKKLQLINELNERILMNYKKYKKRKKRKRKMDDEIRTSEEDGEEEDEIDNEEEKERLANSKLYPDEDLILKDFNDTIGRYDDDASSFSTDSIESKSINKEERTGFDVFDSSWESGIGNGWIRIHTGVNNSLIYLSFDTTTKDVCRDMLLGPELAIFLQYEGELGRRLAPQEQPLKLQDEYLQSIGYYNHSRRTRLGVDPELKDLVGFHTGPASPLADLRGYSRSGYVFVLKGLVFPQWKKRPMAVIGSRIFLYPATLESSPEWLELGYGGGSVCHAPSRLGKLVLRVTGFAKITGRDSEEGEEFSPDSRHLYLGFHHNWDRDLWKSWIRQATKHSSGSQILDLSKTGIHAIPDTVLSYTGVRELYLGDNRLGVTDDDNNRLDILKRFSKLSSIHLEKNNFQNVPRRLLELETLIRVDLSDNKIESITTDIENLINLEQLILDRNGLKDLPKEIGKLRKLKILSLNGNRFENLPWFFKMRALSLTEALSKGDHKEDKINQTHLNEVNLRNNHLKGHIILGNYGNLTHLDVSENKIEKLDVSALQELKFVRCARNILTELALCGKNIISLIAGNNKLKKLSIEPVPGHLEHLDVSYNNLDTLPEWIPDLPFLRALFASHNDLIALPDRLFSHPSRLEVLHLDHNRIQALPPPRRALNLVHLTLQGNALTALPSGFFSNTQKIRVLNLSNNRLIEFYYPGQVTGENQDSLEKLYLTANCLTDTALDALAKFKSLRVLHLAYNTFDTLPESCIASWTELEEIILSGNRLQYLPGNLTNLKHLRVLRVHSNRLLNCPSFRASTSLKVLDLAHNQLDRINLELLVPAQLQFLDVSCNSRLYVDPKQFQQYKSRRPISLIDVSGENRSTLPSHPRQRETLNLEPTTEHPWRLGFSETSGSKDKLRVAQIRETNFCNNEGLFGMFDGESNQQESPMTNLGQIVPRILLEEKTMKETSKEYLKYTLLSSQRELRGEGLKYGFHATLAHISKLPSPRGSAAMKYSLKVASSGEARTALCRAAGPLILAPPKRLTLKHQLSGTAFPDPTVEEVTLEEDDEFLIIANKRLWQVLSIEEAVREARAEANPVLAAKRLQDLAQAYGAEDNLSIIVIRLKGPSQQRSMDLLMRELRHAVQKNRHQKSNFSSTSSSCCCCSNGVFKNIVHRTMKSCPDHEIPTTYYNDDRSSPSGQSDQASAVEPPNRIHPCYPGTKIQLNDDQFRCWEYMLEQNTQLLFNKELDTLTTASARTPLHRNQSRSTPQLLTSPNLSTLLSKRFGSARSFNPIISPVGPVVRFGSGRRIFNGGPNAAYFGSLQRLMPYNLEYDFAVIQERAGAMDSLEQDAGRMQQYWGVATTEL